MASISFMLIEDLLKKDGFDVSLLTYKESSLKQDLPIKIYPILKKDSISSILKACQVIKNEKFDIVHILSTKFMHGRLFLIISFLLKKILRLKIKIIISAHEFYDFSNLRGFLVGGIYHIFLLRYSDLILVFNKDYPKMISSKWFYKKTKEKVIFISKNVQSMRFEKIMPSSIWERKKIKPFILFFGFLRYKKGLPYLVHAFKKILNEFPDLKLVIAGGIGIGPGTQDYYMLVKQIVLKLNLEDRVIFTDFISQEEVMELFNLAEAVIYPYLSIENSGALFPALYSKKAIISSDLPGFRNVLTHGKDGLLVIPKSSEEIAKATIMILKSFELKKNLEINSGKTYTENSFEKLINKYYNIFNI